MTDDPGDHMQTATDPSRLIGRHVAVDRIEGRSRSGVLVNAGLCGVTVRVDEAIIQIPAGDVASIIPAAEARR